MKLSRSFCFLLSLLLFGVIVYAGYYTTDHIGFTIWFGVTTTIVAPFAFQLLLFSIQKRGELIEQLSKVPKIDELIEQAKNTEEKVQALQQQRRDLDKLIAFESKRRTLLAEREIFVMQGELALQGLEKVRIGLEEMTSEKEELPESIQKLLAVIQGIQSEDIVYKMGDKIFVVRKKYFEYFPFYGNVLFEIFKMFHKIFETLERDRKTDADGTVS